MSRHSKHANTAAFLTQKERETSAYGTIKRRLGEDEQQKLDACNLCLHPLREPVASPSGYLYCRECILSNLLAQKTALAEAQQAYDSEQRALAEAADVDGSRAEAARVARFLASERATAAAHVLGRASLGGSAAGGGGPGGSVGKAGVDALEAARRERIDGRERSAVMAEVYKASPWVPAALPTAAKGKVPKPDPAPRDPASGAFLRPRDLVPVTFTHLEGDSDEEAGSGAAGGGGGGEGGSAADSAVPSGSAAGAGGAASKPRATGRARYMCPCCQKGLVYQQVFLLTKAGCHHVFCAACCKSVLARDKRCMLCTKGPITKADLLPLKQAGSAFVGHAGTQATSSHYTPAMMG